MLGSAAIVTLLFGCGGPNGPPFVSSGGGPAARRATSGDLLYVANSLAANGVTVLTYPQGKFVATIANIGGPTGICSDASGNVWVSAYDQETKKFRLYKFVHGGTKPIERIEVPGGARGCAIDAATGDLVTWNAFAGSAGQVDVFPGARKGTPIVYETNFEPVAGTYDNRGNIFADGIVNSGDFIFEELAKDSKSFSIVRLNKPAINGGSVQWDGKYVVVGEGFLSDKGGPQLYRMQVSDDRARVVHTVSLQHVASPARFWIQGSNVVASRRAYTVRRIGLYDYPAGGKQLAVFSGFYNPIGMTVSVPPN
ncbi:MAG: hypothetical protein WAK11_01800 [Candidatus Cybelea sp.]